ncbi:hypothetical protein [Moorena sp. SIO4G3]|uniref:hypothetical protein n=1 Tax=Moorena sp. SIO4G3 TaxID=2607821 RepID=UPI0025FD0719|nr:hypothetical protein [Moorena sp. SIO4G3]
MKYSLEIASVAEAEADSAFLRLSQVTSPTQASLWYALIAKSNRISIAISKTLS